MSSFSTMLPQAQKQWSQLTLETSEAVSQDKSFLLEVDFLQYFVRDKK
jgi:hypothetical protein